ncbi:MAG: hypothetical protein K9N00_05805, partial [Candidatus Marinimicrobia bacterium]|nr:hypothetical protein [Candidatus Neomarinimicrobiota bacterium]
PYIYYGDEVGMWGADDPDCRKPMIWEEFEYEDEKYHPFGLERPVNKVEVNHDLLNHYRKMAGLREKYECLRNGAYETLLTDDQNMLYAFKRSTANQQIIAVFNLSNQVQRIDKGQLFQEKDENWKIIFPARENADKIDGKSCILFYKQ